MAENNAKKINLREVKASDIKNPELKAALAELKKERTQENEQKMIRQLEKEYGVYYIRMLRKNAVGVFEEGSKC